MKNKMIAIAITLFVLLVPFRYLYLNTNIEDPTGSLISFLATLGGTIAAIFIGTKEVKTAE